MMTVVLVIFPVISSIIIVRNLKNLESESFEKKYGSLLENLGTESIWKALWNVWFMVKRGITIAVIVYLTDYPWL
jgi:hypothetical protein